MDSRQALFFDGIRFAIEAADFAHARLRGTLLSLARSLGCAAPMHAETPAAIVDAWSIVDSLHRLRGLIQYAPGLERRQQWPALRVFQDATSAVEDLRNVAQHLNQEIQAMADANWPVWGVLKWFVVNENRTGGRICTLVAGRIAPRAVTVLQPGGRSIPESELPLGMITLSAHNAELCLSDAMEHVRRVTDALENALRTQQGPDVPTSGSDVLIGVDIEFLSD
jgi:hypothetical protein